MSNLSNRNIEIYPWYIASSSLLFWFPIFFLYFSSKVSIEQVLMLEAFYYLAVVIMEVPSGYLSDLLGRRITLIISSVCVLCSYSLFAIADSFAVLIVAQCLLAAHFSFKSGTDSSLLYESLALSNRQDEIGDQLARAQRFGFLATAFAALVGGFVGGYHLVIAYILSAFAAILTTYFAFRFSEPKKHEKADSVLLQFNEIATNLKKSNLFWLFIFSIIIFILVHVPYEFFQPYIKLLFPTQSNYDNSPFIAGILICVTMLAGSYASQFSIPLQNRFGTANALIIIMCIAVLIISVMVTFLNIMVLSIILFRNVPMALSNPIVESMLHDNISDKIRASFISVLSLFSRLAFSMTLFVTAMLTGSMENLDFTQLRVILAGYLIFVMMMIPLLIIGRRKLAHQKKSP